MPVLYEIFVEDNFEVSGRSYGEYNLVLRTVCLKGDDIGSEPIERIYFFDVVFWCGPD